MPSANRSRRPAPPRCGGRGRRRNSGGGAAAHDGAKPLPHIPARPAARALERGTARDQRAQGEDDGEAGDEAADVGPDRNAFAGAGGGADGGDAGEELHDEPEADEEYRGQRDGAEEPEPGDEDADSRPRIQHQVRAEDAGDSAAGADHRDHLVRVDGHLQSDGPGGGDEVEDSVLHVAEGVFDVIAEDPEVDHVAEDVQPAAVNEGGGNDGEWLLEAGGAVPPVDEAAGDDTMIEEEEVEVRLGEGYLV